MKNIISLFATLLLLGCGIGDSVKPISQYPAENYLKNWDKSGATAEQKLKDALACDSQFLSYTSGSGLSKPSLSYHSDLCNKDKSYCYSGSLKMKVRFDGCFIKSGYNYTGHKDCNLYEYASSPICDEERGMTYCQKYPKNDNLCPVPLK